MARIFEKYTKGNYENYQDFKENFRIDAPKNFNFAYDVMDVLAEEQPDKMAMLWTNVEGEERSFTFEDFRVLSNKCANFFSSLGIRKGDMVMLILKRRYEFWISMLALHKDVYKRQSRILHLLWARVSSAAAEQRPYMAPAPGADAAQRAFPHFPAAPRRRLRTGKQGLRGLRPERVRCSREHTFRL